VLPSVVSRGSPPTKIFLQTKTEIQNFSKPDRNSSKARTGGEGGGGGGEGSRCSLTPRFRCRRRRRTPISPWPRWVARVRVRPAVSLAVSPVRSLDIGSAGWVAMTRQRGDYLGQLLRLHYNVCPNRSVSTVVGWPYFQPMTDFIKLTLGLTIIYTPSDMSFVKVASIFSH
jgi:hypothetical protein